MKLRAQNDATAALCPDKDTGSWVGPQTQFDDLGKYKNLLPLPGFQPRIVKPVA
jgi:hypothetical protein